MDTGKNTVNKNETRNYDIIIQFPFKKGNKKIKPPTGALLYCILDNILLSYTAMQYKHYYHHDKIQNSAEAAAQPICQQVLPQRYLSAGRYPGQFLQI